MGTALMPRGQPPKVAGRNYRFSFILSLLSSFFSSSSVGCVARSGSGC